MIALFCFITTVSLTLFMWMPMRSSEIYLAAGGSPSKISCQYFISLDPPTLPTKRRHHINAPRLNSPTTTPKTSAKKGLVAHAGCGFRVCLCGWWVYLSPSSTPRQVTSKLRLVFCIRSVNSCYITPIYVATSTRPVFSHSNILIVVSHFLKFGNNI